VAGHITRNRVQSEEGKFTGYEYVVYELPKSVNTVVRNTDDGFTDDGKLNTTKYPSNKVPNIQKGELENSPVEEDYFHKLPNLKAKVGPKHHRLLNEAVKDTDLLNTLRGLFIDGRFDTLCEWLEYKKDSGKTYAAKSSITRLVNQFSTHTPKEMSVAVNDAIANGYQGIHPKRISDAKIKQLFNGAKRKSL